MALQHLPEEPDARPIDPGEEDRPRLSGAPL